jgi:hypothetical protein
VTAHRVRKVEVEIFLETIETTGLPAMASLAMDVPPGTPREVADALAVALGRSMADIWDVPRAKVQASAHVADTSRTLVCGGDVKVAP